MATCKTIDNSKKMKTKKNKKMKTDKDKSKFGFAKSENLVGQLCKAFDLNYAFIKILHNSL